MLEIEEYEGIELLRIQHGKANAIDGELLFWATGLVLASPHPSNEAGPFDNCLHWTPHVEHRSAVGCLAGH